MPSFYGPIIISYGPLFRQRSMIITLVAIGKRYFAGDWRLLFWWQFVIIISAIDCYFNSDWQSLAKGFTLPH